MHACVVCVCVCVCACVRARARARALFTHSLFYSPELNEINTFRSLVRYAGADITMAELPIEVSTPREDPAIRKHGG